MSESLKPPGLSDKSFSAIRFVLNKTGKRKRKKMIYIEKRKEQKRQNKISTLMSLAFIQFHFGADTADQPLRLMIIKPAGYRLRKGSKLLYRQPAYLICTTTEVALTHLINAYLARWEIEVNFHDEKSILGVGEAQVWNPVSVERTPAFLVAAYAALLLAQMQAFGDRRTEAFEPLPAWRKDHPLRPSLRDLIALLRNEAGTYIARQKLQTAA